MQQHRMADHKPLHAAPIVALRALFRSRYELACVQPRSEGGLLGVVDAHISHRITACGHKRLIPRPNRFRPTDNGRPVRVASLQLAVPSRSL